MPNWASYTSPTTSIDLYSTCINRGRSVDLLTCIDLYWTPLRSRGPVIQVEQTVAACRRGRPLSPRSRYRWTASDLTLSSDHPRQSSLNVGIIRAILARTPLTAGRTCEIGTRCRPFALDQGISASDGDYERRQRRLRQAATPARAPSWPLHNMQADRSRHAAPGAIPVHAAHRRRRWAPRPPRASSPATTADGRQALTGGLPRHGGPKEEVLPSSNLPVFRRTA